MKNGPCIDPDDNQIRHHRNQFHLNFHLTGSAIFHNNGLHIDELGNQRWYQNGTRHRADGPAVITKTGDKHWYQNGTRHRLDGPAIEWSDGDEWYYLMDIRYPYLEWLEKRKHYLIQENLKLVL